MLKSALSLLFDFILSLMDEDTRPNRSNVWASVITGAAILLLKVWTVGLSRSVFVEVLFTASVVALVLLTPDIIGAAKKLIARVEAESAVTVTLPIVDSHGQAVVKPALVRPPSRLVRYYIGSMAAGMIVIMIGLGGFSLWLGISPQLEPSASPATSVQGSPTPMPTPSPSASQASSPATPTPTIAPRSRRSYIRPAKKEPCLAEDRMRGLC
jgi:hypothetical protein